MSCRENSSCLLLPRSRARAQFLPPSYRTPTSLLVAICYAAALAGCAGAQPRHPGAARPLGQISGVWDLEQRITDSEGDQRVDRHEWQIQQEGDSLTGFLSRSITWISRGPQAFACNQRRRATHHTRYLVSGKLATRVLLLSPLAQQGECHLREAPIISCLVQSVAPSSLGLRCGDTSYELSRRSDQPIPLFLAAHGKDQITGVWVWYHRSIDQDGDTKLEHETWHLHQKKHKITGYYDRKVTIHSKDGRPFKCNNQTRYSNQSRFRLEGVVSGKGIRFRELEYLIRDGACDSGERKLDQYAGTFNPEDQTLQISWGEGAQLLLRRY